MLGLPYQTLVTEVIVFIRVIGIKILLFSYRVLAPPGGKSNINLFGDNTSKESASSKPVNSCQAARQQSHVFDSAESNLKVSACQAKRQESHIFDKPAGESKSDVHTSSRVLKAPGGGSSITFG